MVSDTTGFGSSREALCSAGHHATQRPAEALFVGRTSPDGGLPPDSEDGVPELTDGWFDQLLSQLDAAAVSLDGARKRA
jgi:hypothetical protein